MKIRPGAAGTAPAMLPSPAGVTELFLSRHHKETKRDKTHDLGLATTAIGHHRGRPSRVLSRNYRPDTRRHLQQILGAADSGELLVQLPDRLRDAPRLPGPAGAGTHPGDSS
jgi:hypothetical protein